MNAATCSCRTDRYRTPGLRPAASIKCMIVVPGSPTMCRTPSRRSAPMATSAPFTAAALLVFPGLPASAEHDVDGLELGVAEQFVQALLAADAGLLHPAERHPREMPGRPIDPQVPGVERRCHPVGPADV